MSFLNELQFLLRKHGIFPKKSLGQNFMVDASILQSIASYASLTQSDVVLDIGAGIGFLTRILAEKCRRVLAVESDPKLVKVLNEQLCDLPNIQILADDVFKAQIPEFNKVVSIPPYNISSPLLLWLFHQKIDIAVLILQKEFANRIVASVGSVDYGWLAVVAYYYMDVELLDEVPKLAFHPQPQVDSVIVRLKPKSSPPFILKNEIMFKHLTQSLFAHRNKKIKNVIEAFVKNSRAQDKENLAKTIANLSFRDRRARELAPEGFGVLTNALFG